MIVPKLQLISNLQSCIINSALKYITKCRCWVYSGMIDTAMILIGNLYVSQSVLMYGISFIRVCQSRNYALQFIT